MALLANPLEAFTWGAGGARMTPEEVARQREIASALMAKGIDTSPVGHWTQGLARVADAFAGAVNRGQADRAEASNSADSQSRIAALLGGMTGGGAAQFPEAPSASEAAPVAAVAPVALPAGAADLKGGIEQTASALGIDPIDLATAISYETAGTFDPAKSGPTTQYGQHRGLIQFGEPQAKQYGVDWSNPVASQLGPDGAVAKYLRDTGVKPGMGLLDIYSAINAGGVGKYDASDANNGGAPGTVRDKVEKQMAAHRAKALAMFGDGQVASNDAQAAISAALSQQGAPDITTVTPANVTPQLGSQLGGEAGAPFIDQMTAPQSMTGGAPMPMQGAAPAALSAPASVPPSPVAAAPQGMNPGMQAAIAQALSSPYASDGEKKIAGLLLQQQFDQQDPTKRLEMEYKRAQIAKLTDPNARDKFGNSVIWGQDKDGKWVAMQPSSGGGLVPAVTPDGITLSPPGIGQVNLGTSYAFRDRNGNVVNQAPIDNAGKAAAQAGGKAEGEAAFDLPRVEQNAQQTLDVLERMKTHPGREGSTGFIEGVLPSRTSDQVAFQSLVDQTQGQSFLQAFQMLKGAGQITDIEGRKATEAISRLGNQRLSDADYLSAISDLEEVVKRGLERAKVQAGKGGGSQAPSGAPKRLKFNPATGELE